MSLTPQWTSNPQKPLPSAAGAIAVTPSGSAFGNSSWYEVSAAVSVALVLLAVNAHESISAVDFEIDVGTGGAGSETVIATFVGAAGPQGANKNDDDTTLRLPVPIDNIANGARVAVRMRKTGTATTAWAIKLTVLEKPIVGALVTTVKATKAIPSAAASVRPTANATPWANGAYTQVTASMPANAVLSAVMFAGIQAGSEYEVDISQGAAGSEVVLTTVRGRGDIATCSPSRTPFQNPVGGVTSGSRLAVRARGSAAGMTIWAKPEYQETPL